MMMELEIIPFTDELSLHFYDLNASWLRKYFFVEPIDEQMMKAPRQFFLDKGGYIFFARQEGMVIGTFALIKHSDTVFELSKMAVHESFRGRKTGNSLVAAAIEKAKALGLEKLILYSHTKLEPAIHLYKKYGFVEVPLGSSVYQRSNIKMELSL